MIPKLHKNINTFTFQILNHCQHVSVFLPFLLFTTVCLSSIKILYLLAMISYDVQYSLTIERNSRAVYLWSDYNTSSLNISTLNVLVLYCNAPKLEYLL